MGYVIKGKQYTVYGDMLKSIYDINGDGVVDNSKLFDGHAVNYFEPAKAYQNAELQESDTLLASTAVDQNVLTLTVTKTGTYLVTSYAEIQPINASYFGGAKLIYGASTILGITTFRPYVATGEYQFSVSKIMNLTQNDTLKLNITSSSASYYTKYRRCRIMIKEV